jgi:hypothetical protein
MKKIFLTVFMLTLISAFCFAEEGVTPVAPTAKKENACCTTKTKKAKKMKKTKQAKQTNQAVAVPTTTPAETK